MLISFKSGPVGLPFLVGYTFKIQFVLKVSSSASQMRPKAPCLGLMFLNPSGKNCLLLSIYLTGILYSSNACMTSSLTAKNCSLSIIDVLMLSENL